MRRGIILSVMMLTAFVAVGCEQRKPEPVTPPQQVVEAGLNQAEQAVADTGTVESILPDESDAGLAMETVDTAAETAVDMVAESEPVETVLDPAVNKAPTVQEIQTALKNAGLYEGKVDGDLGPKTDRAIRNFQSQNSLKVDGKVGPMTWAKLSSYLSAAPATVPAEMTTATY